MLLLEGVAVAVESEGVTPGCCLAVEGAPASPVGRGRLVVVIVVIIIVVRLVVIVAASSRLEISAIVASRAGGEEAPT